MKKILETLSKIFAFQSCTFGDNEEEVLVKENYAVLKRLTKESNPDVTLPETVREFVLQRKCDPGLGRDPHKCEEGECPHCTMAGFLFDNAGFNVQKYLNEFADVYNVTFVLDEEISYKSYMDTSPELPGARRYSQNAKVSNPVSP